MRESEITYSSEAAHKLPSTEHFPEIYKAFKRYDT